MATTPLRATGVRDGARAFFRGLEFVVKTPRTWPLALVPAVAAFALTVTFAGLGLWAVFTWIDTPGWQIAACVGAVILAVILGATLAQPVSGPALDALVREQEHALGIPASSKTGGSLESFSRSLRVTVTTLGIGVPPFILMSLLELVFPPVAIVTWPAKLVLSALLATWNLVDYPFAQRGAGVRQRFQWFRDHVGAALGFGAVLALLALVPFAGLFVLPVGVVGAARLVADTERRG